jgi:hypothetical protein
LLIASTGSTTVFKIVSMNLKGVKIYNNNENIYLLRTSVQNFFFFFLCNIIVVCKAQMLLKIQHGGQLFFNNNNIIKYYVTSYKFIATKIIV